MQGLIRGHLSQPDRPNWALDVRFAPCKTWRKRKNDTTEETVSRSALVTTVLGAGLLAPLILAPVGASADSVEDFYKGRNIQLIIATGPGAQYDFMGRAVARHFGKYIPGNPTVTPQNMAGASGFRAANHLYTVAPKDGTVIGTFNNAIAFYQAMRQPGIQYKAEDFSWVGAVPQDTPLVSVWSDTGVKTIEDAKKKEVIMGATGAGGNFAGHVALLNSVLGTKFKIVTGYDGGNSINLAIERGEVQGKANTTWAAFKSITPEWVKDHKIVPLVQFGATKDPELPNVPLLGELATNDAERRMFDLVCSTAALGQPFAAPPDIPQDRLAALRTAFEKTLLDPGFRKDAAKLGQQVEMIATTGDEVTKIVKRTIETPEPLVERLRVALEVKGAKRAKGSGGGK
jgi:tripartite-type tricarboxylate transporter receptor subunit TctC